MTAASTGSERQAQRSGGKLQRFVAHCRTYYRGAPQTPQVRIIGYFS
jgi:hypothetical protein